MEEKWFERTLIVLGIIGLLVLLWAGVANAAGTVCQVPNGCTGLGTAPSFGQVLVGNSSGGYTLTATSSLGISGGGSSASSTLLSDNNTFSGKDVFSKLLNLSATSSAVLSTDSTGNVIATTSIGTNYITGALGTINTVSLTRGGSITINAASSTALIDKNNWAGLQTFAAASSTNAAIVNEWLTGPAASSLLALDNNNDVIATSSIGWGLIKGPASSIFGFNASGVPTATTSIGVNYLSGTLPIANGGTGASSLTSGYLLYYNGTSIAATSSPITVGSFIASTTLASNFIAGELGIATSTTQLSQFGISGMNIGTTTIISGGQIVNTVASSTCATTCTINWDNGNQQVFLLNGNLSLVMNSTSSNPVNGGYYTVYLQQDGTGSRTLTWLSANNIRWANGTTTISNAANSCTIIGFHYLSSPPNETAAGLGIYLGLASSTAGACI